MMISKTFNNFRASPLEMESNAFVSFSTISSHYSLPDNVLQYIDDILGGKVIKQEGNKCLVIDKKGNVKTGLTKEKVDKGYEYKLVRE
jgi:hypothetical protein